MSDVFDLDALSAESSQAPFTVRLGREEFVLPAPQTLPWDKAASIDSGTIVNAIQVLLGEDFDRFAKHKLATGAFVANGEADPPQSMAGLLLAYLRHYGLRPGESPASSDS